MIEPHTVRGCRWAEPALFQDTPLWIASECFPWTCHVDGYPARVTDTALCTTCMLWTPRTAGPARPQDPAPCSCEVCRARNLGLTVMESKSSA